MRVVLRFDPNTSEILQVVWTSSSALPMCVDAEYTPLPHQLELDDPEAVARALSLSWKEIGDAIKTACEMSPDGNDLIRRSTGETLSGLKDCGVI